MSKYKNKPLSPHLSIYRWQLPMLTSALHRLTGLALFCLTIIFTWLFAFFVYDVEIKNCVINPFLNDSTFMIVGQIFATIVALISYYHMLNGLRHLYWDSGKGYDLKTTYITGYSVFIGSVVLTALSWYLVLQKVI